MKKISEKDLKEIILSETQNIISKGYTNDLKMNQMDASKNNDGTSEKKEVKTGNGSEPYLEKAKEGVNLMNDEKGNGEKISTAVSVEADKKINKGGSIEGQHKADFESKKENPKVSVENDPFAKNKIGITPEMNKEDKEIDLGTVTFAETGKELDKGSSVGQKKLVPSETAKNVDDKIKSIAKAIQLPESFKSEKELVGFIKTEAIKLAR